MRLIIWIIVKKASIPLGMLFFKNPPSMLPAQHCCSSRKGNFSQSGKDHACPFCERFFQKTSLGGEGSSKVPRSIFLLSERGQKLLRDSAGELLGSPLLWRNSPRTALSPAGRRQGCSQKLLSERGYLNPPSFLTVSIALSS